MNAYQLIIQPQTAFGTPLVGDTLFGQICWGIVEQFGTEKLEGCLQSYTDGKPFLVVSDAFPKGFLPLPTLPSTYWEQQGETDRKQLKKRQWLPENALSANSKTWQIHAKTSSDIAADLSRSHTQPHNSLNRQTHTTGAGGSFAPYESEQIWYVPNHLWQIYLLLDEGRLKAEELQQVITNIGHTGYGRDASIGLGKFRIADWATTELFAQHSSGNAVFTLAASCPQQQGYDSAHSYYQTQTRFGRHGNIQATTGQPFKRPILMAQTGAVFSGARAPLVGQGIGGISAAQAQAVHQGYAPALAFTLDIVKLSAEAV